MEDKSREWSWRRASRRTGSSRCCSIEDNTTGNSELSLASFSSWLAEASIDWSSSAWLYIVWKCCMKLPIVEVGLWEDEDAILEKKKKTTGYRIDGSLGLGKNVRAIIAECIAHHAHEILL